MLQGKGFFIWQIQKCEDGNADRIVEAAAAANLKHVTIKIADGVHAYPEPRHETLLRNAVFALKQAGFAVWGWQFIYGRNPRNPTDRQPIAEADIAVQRVRDLGLHGFAIDVENTGHPVFTYHGDADDAEVYLERLRGGLGQRPIALASHRFFNQPRIPFNAFLRACDLVMPQVYWVKGDPMNNLLSSYRQYRKAAPHLPYVPIGSAYFERDWGAKPEEVLRFLVVSQGLGLPGVTFWSWQDARADPRFGTQLWDVVAFHKWETDPSSPLETSKRWVTAPRGLIFRSRPARTPDARADDRILTPGTLLVAIGEPLVADDGDMLTWQRVRLGDSRLGWVLVQEGKHTYVADRPPAERAVRVTAGEGVPLRFRPFIEVEPSATLAPGEVVTAVADPTPVDRAGVRWQFVRARRGQEGYIDAAAVEAAEGEPETAAMP